MNKEEVEMELESSCKAWYLCTICGMNDYYTDSQEEMKEHFKEKHNL